MGEPAGIHGEEWWKGSGAMRLPLSIVWGKSRDHGGLAKDSFACGAMARTLCYVGELQGYIKPVSDFTATGYRAVGSG